MTVQLVSHPGAHQKWSAGKPQGNLKSILTQELDLNLRGIIMGDVMAGYNGIGFVIILLGKGFLHAIYKVVT